MTTTLDSPTSTPPATGSRRHVRGFWLIAAIFAVTLAFSAAPAPLYVLYQQEQGFSSFTITLIFAVYAAGVAVSLFLAGHLSDQFGRRRMMAPAVLLNILAALVFLSTHDLAWLLVARFVGGLGVGMITATATAHLTELHRIGRPNATPVFAAAVGTAANLGGIGVGPLVTGFLAEYVPEPLFTPYMVFAFLMVAGLLGVVLVPETVDVAADDWRYRPQRVVVPTHARWGFWAAGAIGFTSFAVFGFFTSLAPSFLVNTLHEDSHLVAGAISFLVFGASAAAQVLTGRWHAPRLFAVGLAVLPIGVVIVISGVLGASLPWLLAGGLVVGVGAGIAFRAAVTSVIEFAPARSRGEVLAGLFLIAYLGLSIPVVLLGITLQFVPMAPSLIAFGVFIAALLVLSALLLAAARRRHRRHEG